MTTTQQDLDLAWAILLDLSDRTGIPEWLGDKSDLAAHDVAKDIADVIATHRAAPLASDDTGKGGTQ